MGTVAHCVIAISCPTVVVPPPTIVGGAVDAR
jgi:hypothetical protein